MKYRLLAGAAAGCIVSFWTTVHFHFFATLYWGVFPLLLGIIPFAAALLTGRPLFAHLLPASLRRYLPAAAAAVTPAALFLLYEASSSMAFIDGTSGLQPLLLSVLLYAFGAGLPLDVVAAAEHDAGNSSGDRLPWLVMGAGFGSLLFSLLEGGLSLPLLYIIKVVAAGSLMLRFAKEREALIHAGNSAPAKGKKKSGAKTVLPLPAPWPLLQFLLPATLVFFLPFVLQTMAETPAFTDGALARMPAAVLIALGLGWLAGLLAARKGQGAHVGVASLIVGGALLANFAGSWLADWFPAIYEAYYAGADASFSTQLFSIHLLGGLFFTMLGLAQLYGNKSTVMPNWGLAASLLLGLVAWLALHELLSFVWTALGAAILLSVIALYALLHAFKRDILWAVMAVLFIAQAALLFTVQTEGFNNFFNPAGFEITADEHTPAGRMTLLQSRDYDDRFHAVFWNQQSALTQSSRAVQSDLHRMGHIPMLLAPKDAGVLVLGLGSSLTIEAVTYHNPASITCVEPQAAMLRLSQATASTSRPRPWLDGITLHNERIGAFLARSAERYDVIISAEPLASSAPEAALFTEDYFHSVAERLSDDGVFAQWLSVARMDLESMRPVINALLAVFPETEMWISSPDPENAMVGLVAAKKPFGASRPSQQRFEQLLGMSKDIRLHFLRCELGSFASLLSAYGTNRDGLQRLATGTESRGAFDPLALRGAPDPQKIFLDVHNILGSRTPPDRMLSALSDSVATLTSQLFQQRPLIMRARASALAGDDTAAVRICDEILVSNRANEEAGRVLGDVFLRQAAGYVGAEQFGPAVTLITRALQLVPVNTYLLRLLMIASFNIGDREAAGLSIDGIRRLDPSHAGFRDNQATIRARQGATDDALLLYENAITLDRRNEEFYCNMASFHYSQNRVWEAVRVLDQATEAAYYPAKAWYLRGLFYAEQGQIRYARESYEGYLKAASPIDPYREEVLRRLEELKKFEEK